MHKDTGKQITLFEDKSVSESAAIILHKSFIHIEKMQPEEYKDGGENLCIHYTFFESLFDLMIIASTGKGICYMAFEKDETDAFSNLYKQFPHALYEKKEDVLTEDILRVFKDDESKIGAIKLHIKGSDFHLTVWKALLKIPKGQLSTYAQIARDIGHPNASRAVGTAIGRNPIAYLIPCHRIVRTSGALGGYMWGIEKKAAIIAWEKGNRDKIYSR